MMFDDWDRWPHPGDAQHRTDEKEGGEGGGGGQDGPAANSKPASCPPLSTVGTWTVQRCQAGNHVTGPTTRGAKGKLAVNVSVTKTSDEARNYEAHPITPSL